MFPLNKWRNGNPEPKKWASLVHKCGGARLFSGVFQAVKRLSRDIYTSCSSWLQVNLPHNCRIKLPSKGLKTQKSKGRKKLQALRQLIAIFCHTFAIFFFNIIAFFLHSGYATLVSMALCIARGPIRQLVGAFYEADVGENYVCTQGGKNDKGHGEFSAFLHRWFFPVIKKS